MSYNSVVYKVMIASPGDVVHEKTLIREVLAEWNAVNGEHRGIVLLPVSWDTHSTPAMGESAQSIINKQVLRGSDLLVGVFWTRIGTPTDDYASGTVEEIEEHIALDKPTMLYFSAVPVRPDSVDPEQYTQLTNFREACKRRGLYESYDNPNQFKEKFYHHLQLKLNHDPYFRGGTFTGNDDRKTISSSVPDIPPLSKEAQIMLVEASNDATGHIMRLPHLGGLILQSNGRSFVPETGASARETAVWEAALKELESQNLIEATSYKRHAFKVTRHGYEIGELLK
jgi:hypothetical protein